MPARVGRISEPVVNLAKFGWMVMSPEQEDHSNMYLTESTTHNYGLLYRLDIHGLDNTSNDDQYTVYKNSKKNFNEAYKLDTKIVCHGNHIILLYTLTRIGVLLFYQTYLPSYKLLLHSLKSMVTR